MTVTVLPRRAERTSSRPYATLAGLQVLDVLTTGLILSHYADGHAEGNPIVAALFGGVGLLLGLLVLLALKIGVVGLFWHLGTKVRLATALYSAVIVNNALVLGLAVAG